MNYPEYAGHGGGVPEAHSRGEFIKAAYSHLAVAILAFAVLSFGLYASGVSFAMLKMLGASKWSWLAVMGAFMVVGWLATNAADNSENKSTQYLALGGYVLAEALIFAPMLAMASIIAPGSIQAAAIATLALVARCIAPSSDSTPRSTPSCNSRRRSWAALANDLMTFSASLRVISPRFSRSATAR